MSLKRECRLWAWRTLSPKISLCPWKSRDFSISRSCFGVMSENRMRGNKAARLSSTCCELFSCRNHFSSSFQSLYSLSTIMSELSRNSFISNLDNSSQSGEFCQKQTSIRNSFNVSFFYSATLRIRYIPGNSVFSRYLPGKTQITPNFQYFTNV